MNLESIFESVPIFILLTGTLGNMFNIIIFSRLRQSTTFRFLLYLSISDMLVLTMGGVEIIAKINYAHETSIFSCNTQKFLTYTTTYISTFISIAMNVDRAMTISRMVSHCRLNNESSSSSRSSVSYENLNKRLVDIICLTIVFVTFLLNSHFLVLFKPLTLVYFEHDLKQNTSLDENNRIKIGNQFKISLIDLTFE
jgi:hypothetical protein